MSDETRPPFRTKTERLLDRIFNDKAYRIYCACGDWADYISLPDYQMVEMAAEPCPDCGRTRDFFDVTDEYEKNLPHPREG